MNNSRKAAVGGNNRKVENLRTNHEISRWAVHSEVIISN